jgi:hypothetical protein
MLKDIIEERQEEAQKRIADKISECDGGWSPRFEPVLNELDTVVAETAQIVAREMLRKINEGVEDYKVGKEMTKINTTGADYIYVYDLKHFVLQSLENELSAEVLSK